LSACARDNYAHAYENFEEVAKMKKKLPVAAYIILGLALIGVASKALTLIIPIAVFGIIFLLYKFPPSTWGKNGAKFNGPKFGGGPKSSGKSKERRTREASFRVIEGNKRNSDEPPKYH
jgi:hypothetical protein